MKINLKNYLKQEDKIWAHIRNDKNPETLIEHSELVYKYFLDIIKVKNLEKIFTNIIQQLSNSEDEQTIIKKLIHNCIYLHDFGKINPRFQTEKMKNSNFPSENSKLCDSNHSRLSSFLFINTFKDECHSPILKRVLYNLAYIQSKHHGNLSNLEEFTDNLETLQDEIERTKGDEYNLIKMLNCEIKIRKRTFSCLVGNSKNPDNDYLFYILMKLIFGLLTSCDFYATGQYMNDIEIDNFNTLDSDFFNDYLEYDIYKGIRRYENGENPFGENDINNLRSEMFLEVENNLLSNLDKNVYYLEMPTGAGKTNVSINLARILVDENSEINNVFYVFPFNTLIEQTGNIFREIFEKGRNDQIGIINSTTPIFEYSDKDDEPDDKPNYDLNFAIRQYLNYPIVMTTHVNLFNYLFGTNRECNFPLSRLCNSVIIIDEIQSYKNGIWKEIIHMLYEYSTILNIKMIIMSATLPKLDLLLGIKEDIFCSLITDPQKYYDSEFFKNRVNLDFSLLTRDYYIEKEIDYDSLANDILDIVRRSNVEDKNGNFKRGRAKVLIEFITKRTCRNFYKALKGMDLPDFKIIEISGIDNKFKRKKILEQIESEESIIICATQVIEAGIDIDTDIGFKDISMLDSEEQFLGRINRNCRKRNCYGYFFNLFNARRIYKNDMRLQYDIKNTQYQGYLINKNFRQHYNNTFNLLERQSNQCKGTTTNWEDFITMVKENNFFEVKKRMRLIDEQSYDIYLPLKISREDLKTSREDLDGRIWENYKKLCSDSNDSELDGKIVWGNYKKLIQNWKMGYAEKRIQLSKFNEMIINFIIPIREEPKFDIEDRIGDIYYLKNYSQFIDDENKFDIDEYCKLNRIMDNGICNIDQLFY